MIYKNAKVYTARIGEDVFTCINDDDVSERSIQLLSTLISYLKENKIDFEYASDSDDEFEYGIRIAIPSKEIDGLCASCNPDDDWEYYIQYMLADGDSGDWELDYDELIDFIEKYPNHEARMI